MTYDLRPAPLIPFWQTQIKNKTVKPLCEWDYKKTKTSDTVFVLGSGPSVRDLSEKDFSDCIALHNSIGFNMWISHDFVPTVYECEAPDDHGILYALWKKKEAEYQKVPFVLFDCMKEHIDLNLIPQGLIDNMYLAETHFILGDKTKASYQKSLADMLSLGFFSPKERLSVIARRRSSGVFNLSCALQMGYKEIVLVGFDMKAHDYFHEHSVLKKPGERYWCEDPATGIPASQIIEAMVESVARPMGVKVWIGSEKSVLYPFLPVYKWGE